jgi:hypothetical protein
MNKPYNGSSPAATVIGRRRSFHLPGVFLLVFVTVSLLNAWPFVWYKYVPFVDHPSHLLKANIIRHFNNSTLNYSDNFKINCIPAPNILCDYLTAGVALAMPIDAAARLVTALSVVLLPLSLLFWLTAFVRENKYWAVVGLTMAWSSLLWWGNENFCFAANLFFFFIGAIARLPQRNGRVTVVTCTVLATILYLGHFFVFLLAVVGTLIHVLTTQPRSARAWATHSIIIAPGLLLGLIWFTSGGFPGENPRDIDFSLDAKLRAISEGIKPFPWFIGYQDAWWSALSLSLAVFLIYRSIVLWRTGGRFPGSLSLFVAVLGVLLSGWFIISMPDQRAWWLFALISLAALPRPTTTSSKAVILLAGVALAVGTNLDAAKFFRDAQARFSMAEETFARFPKNLRLAYLKDPLFPEELHRSFEYYHIRYGGVGPHHLAGPEQSVSWRAGRPPHVGIYIFSSEALGDWLTSYDAVLIASPLQGSPQRDEMINTLISRGYRPYSPLPFALFLSPTYVIQPTP